MMLAALMNKCEGRVWAHVECQLSACCTTTNWMSENGYCHFMLMSNLSIKPCRPWNMVPHKPLFGSLYDCCADFPTHNSFHLHKTAHIISLDRLPNKHYSSTMVGILVSTFQCVCIQISSTLLPPSNWDHKIFRLPTYIIATFQTKTIVENNFATFKNL